MRKLLNKKIKSEDNPKAEELSNDSENVALDYNISGDDLKMVFVVREDLKMGIGKQCSQVAHAAVGSAYFQIGLCSKILIGRNGYHKKCMRLWDECGSKKVVLKTDSLAHLKELSKSCKKAGINSKMICDAVLDKFI